MVMIRCGIIGYGKMGKIRAKTIVETQVGSVELVFDPLVEQTGHYKRAATIDDLLHSPQIDTIFVCTPNYLISSLSKKSLSSGKHVFAEKPPALNSVALQDVLVTSARAPSQTLMYGFNHRHHESVKRMKEIVQSRELGDVLWMRGRYGKEVDKSYFSGWRADPELAGAGILLDQGIHMVDLMLHLGGPFNEVKAFVSNLYWKIEGIEDNVFAIFRNSASGVCASLHSTMTQWRYLFSLEVFLEGGALILNGLKTSSGAYGDEILSIKRNPTHLYDGRYEEEEQIAFTTDDSWRSEVDHFFHSIKTNRQPQYGNSGDAMQLMQLIDEVYTVGRS